MVGARQVAVIDPGPEAAAHTTALAAAVVGATSVSILVTHGHPDHALGARGLSSALAEAGVPARVRGPAGIEGVTEPLAEGDAVATDHGDLVAIETPGHARAHLSFHWPARRALFAGDLLLGKGDTVWVGEYAGAVADYLRSIERVRDLDLAVIYPAHGPPLTDPAEALDRYVAHRLERIRQVEAALAARPDAGVEDLLETVYGAELPSGVRRAALMSMEALKAHVEGAPDGA
jgi:glyoxylase-like metal-dependent hydrolase (beta-lactamase superfamily II)